MIELLKIQKPVYIYCPIQIVLCLWDSVNISIFRAKMHIVSEHFWCNSDAGAVTAVGVPFRHPGALPSAPVQVQRFLSSDVSSVLSVFLSGNVILG